MNKFLQAIFICILSFIFCKCSETQELPKGRYDYNTRGKYMKGKLSDSSFAALKNDLLLYSSEEIKDTIVIKYDFNNADCWGGQHEMVDSLILQIIQSYQKGVVAEMVKRPGISVFEFREQGNETPKYRKWNNNVKIDNGFLQRLFFTERVVCGTSVIVLPDHQFLLVKTDPHFEALYHFSQKDMLDTIFRNRHNNN